MKTLSYLGFCMLLVVGFGCAITDYGTITDNNQITFKGGKVGGVQAVVDTDGKAHIQETSQIATIWPDGTDELISFVDQWQNGTATLTTFNNFSTGSEPTFHDDLYCNTSRSGCSVFTAPDDNDANLFDGTFNSNCSGARSLSILLSTGRYYGECGKMEQRGSKIDLQSKVQLINSSIFAERYGREGLLFYWNRSNLFIRLTNDNGENFSLPVRGSGEMWASTQDNMATFDMRNSLISSTLSWYADYLQNDATDATKATISYNGISMDFDLAGSHPGMNSEQIRAIRNRAY